MGVKLIGYSGEPTDLTIPDVVSYGGYDFNVTAIGESAFCNCTSLTSVVIGNGVQYIEKEAFSGCSFLNSVVIGNSVMYIQESAFSFLPRLTSLVIGNNVGRIGKNAFQSLGNLFSVLILRFLWMESNQMFI